MLDPHRPDRAETGHPLFDSKCSFTGSTDILNRSPWGSLRLKGDGRDKRATPGLGVEASNFALKEDRNRGVIVIGSNRPIWRNWFTLGLIAVAVQSTLVFLISVAKLRSGTDDTDAYYRYATQAWQGKVPYRDFLVEYPPLAIPLFLAPAAFAKDVVEFKVALAVEMLLCNGLAVLFVARWVERREGLRSVPARLAWYTVFVLILCRLVVTRYDAAPMLVGFVAAAFWSSNRGALGGLAASLGALLKIYPAAIALVASVGDWKRGRRPWGALAFILTSILGVAAWFSICGVEGVSKSIGYHSGRGFEYGSLGSGLQMLAAKIVGAEILISRDHGSFSSITPWSELVLRGIFPLQAASILAISWIFARRGANETIRYSGAAILAFVVTGKVFSPQYLIWLIPFMAALEAPIGRRGRWLFASVCASTLLAPSALNSLPRTSLWVILAYNGRNVLIIWLLILLVFGPASPRAHNNQGEADDRPAGGR